MEKEERNGKTNKLSNRDLGHEVKRGKKILQLFFIVVVCLFLLPFKKKVAKIIHNLTTTAKSNTHTLEMLDIKLNRMKSTLNTE